MTYRIYSRWPAWARWRIVSPAPHAEHYAFDANGLTFPTWNAAQEAKARFEVWNVGEYKIVPEAWRLSGNPSVEREET